jgi:glycosyltransferase involved in cell wall biosynthesis
MLNEKGAIQRCIESILDQTYPTDFLEIVIVDGMSSDGSRQIVDKLSQQHSNIKLVDNPQKRTPNALNIGIKNSSGDVVIILGAHTRIDTNFVHFNIKYMQDKNVKCTGGTQKNVGDTFLQQAIGVAMGSKFGIPSAPYRFQRKAGFVDTVVYAAYDKSLFDEIGLFDETLYISEDAELNWRIRKAGYQIYFSPDIQSYYYPRRNLRTLFKQFFNYGILRVNVIKKHIDAVTGIHLIPPALLVVSTLLLILGFLNPVFLKVLAGICAFYFVYLLFGSTETTIKEKRPVLLFILPAIFFTMHISWGLGFLVGLYKTYK